MPPKYGMASFCVIKNAYSAWIDTRIDTQTDGQTDGQITMYKQTNKNMFKNTYGQDVPHSHREPMTPSADVTETSHVIWVASNYPAKVTGYSTVDGSVTQVIDISKYWTPVSHKS